MLFQTLISTALVASGVLATKGYSPFPLANGFPSPSAKQLKAIELAAGGSLPNTPLPSKLTAGATVTLQLIALNELFEVAYFTELLHNVTSNVPGYKLEGEERAYVIKTLTAVQAQEQLHALGANGILANAHEKTISPCRYQFPVTTFEGAIALAATFTDVVLSVLPLAQTTFGSDGGDETGLVQLVGSIIASEAEQVGWYRYVQGKVPSSAPFLTTSNPAFAFTALQSFIVPGSCPNINLISAAIPTFEALNVLSAPGPKDTVVSFSVKGKVCATKNTLVYISGQNLPVSVKIQNAVYRHGVTTFKAALPFNTDGFAHGLTIAAVTKGANKHYASPAAVAASTVYGPGLLEIA